MVLQQAAATVAALVHLGLVDDCAMDTQLLDPRCERIVRFAGRNLVLYRFSRDLSLHKPASDFLATGKLHDGCCPVLGYATPLVVDDHGSLRLRVLRFPIQE